MRFALAFLLVLVLAVPSVARADEASVGDPPTCGDTTVATLSIVDCLGIEGVPSLDDEAPSTADAVRAFAAAAGVVQDLPEYCRIPAEVVFYTASLWVDLAQAMATDASPCAEYYFSIPALAADKTELRGPLQPELIRAFGPRFHAMAEIHLTGWSGWVAASPTRTWCAAGVEARRRMVDKNFRVELGDSWSINELSSAVRQGGPARVNATNFIRCLYDGGDGSLPAAAGNVFVVGLGQNTNTMSVYKPNLRNWLADSAFWAEMRRSVRWWGQEVYAHPSQTLVPDESRNARSRSLADYLFQVANLAEAGPSEIAVARDYLRAAHYPLGSAAWRYATGFGDTMVPAVVMQELVSIEQYAMRQTIGERPQTAAPFVGYAWAPNNLVQPRLPTAEFNAGTRALARRLASALRWTLAQGGSAPPGACGPPDTEPIWCGGALEGATFNGLWALLTSWED